MMKDGMCAMMMMMVIKKNAVFFLKFASMFSKDKKRVIKRAKR